MHGLLGHEERRSGAHRHGYDLATIDQLLPDVHTDARIVAAHRRTMLHQPLLVTVHGNRQAPMPLGRIAQRKPDGDDVTLVGFRGDHPLILMPGSRADLRHFVVLQLFELFGFGRLDADVLDRMEIDLRQS